MSQFLEIPHPDSYTARAHTHTGMPSTGCDVGQEASLTQFDQGVSLLAVLHVGEVHLPALQALLLITALVSTLELTWKTRGVTTVNAVDQVQRPF